MYKDVNTANSASAVARIAEENESYFREVKNERQKASLMVKNTSELLESEKKQNENLFLIIANQGELIKIKEKEAIHSRKVNLFMGAIAVVSLLVGIASLLVAILK